MDLSIIILNYKTAGLVKQCIKTIKLFEPVLSYEILAVDNASADGVGEMLAERFPDVKFIAAPANLGYAGGNNLGIRQAKGRYILIMNPDITVRPGAIDAMVAYMDEQADIGLLGPKLVRPDRSLDESCYSFPRIVTPIYRRTPLGKLPAGKRELARYIIADYDRSAAREVDWLLGAALMVRNSALAKVGLLDERFFLYFEDTDWCRRFREKGFRIVYFPDAEMVHYHERLSAQASPLSALLRAGSRAHIVSAIKYFWKWAKDAKSVRMKT